MSLITSRIGRDNGGFGLRKWDCRRQLSRVTSTQLGERLD